MKLKQFPRLSSDCSLEAKLQALYEWCYNLSLALKEGDKNGEKTS